MFDGNNVLNSHSIRGFNLSAIYSDNVAAKVFQVAHRGLKQEVSLSKHELKD
jgi:hypothetical protein